MCKQAKSTVTGYIISVSGEIDVYLLCMHNYEFVARPKMGFDFCLRRSRPIDWYLKSIVDVQHRDFHFVIFGNYDAENRSFPSPPLALSCIDEAMCFILFDFYCFWHANKSWITRDFCSALIDVELEKCVCYFIHTMFLSFARSLSLSHFCVNICSLLR